MKFETFKAGRWTQRLQYKSFEPVRVNHDWTWEDAITNTLLEKANRALGETPTPQPDRCAWRCRCGAVDQAV